MIPLLLLLQDILLMSSSRSLNTGETLGQQHEKKRASSQPTFPIPPSRRRRGKYLKRKSSWGHPREPLGKLPGPKVLRIRGRSTGQRAGPHELLMDLEMRLDLFTGHKRVVTVHFWWDGDSIQTWEGVCHPFCLFGGMFLWWALMQCGREWMDTVDVIRATHANLNWNMFISNNDVSGRGLFII